ncbi:MAG: ribose-phosphate pyrophosphokinase [Gammaproteobacteria bacterium WSBS_2016_MAG_OTU1]
MSADNDFRQRLNDLDDLLLLGGSACPQLTGQVAEHLNVQPGRITLRQFSDGESYVELDENVRGKSVFILQTLCAPTNDHLMELMLMIDAVRRSSAAQVVAVIPYLGYARQDRRPRSIRAPISARVVADMLTGVGVDRLLTIDLHAEQIQGFYQIPVDNIYAMPALMGDLARVMDIEKALIVAPDIGGVVRARAFANSLGTDLAIIDKRRPRANVAKVMNIIGDVSGKDCFIVDDIVDTANTLCQAAEALKAAKARRVCAYCSHPVLSGGAPARIATSAIDELVVTDTIPLLPEAQNCDRIRELTIAHVLAEAMQRVHHHRSLSSLFS